MANGTENEARVAKDIAAAVEEHADRTCCEALVTWPEGEVIPNSFCLQLEDDEKYVVVVMKI